MPPAESNETPKYNLPPPVSEAGVETSPEQSEAGPADAEAAPKPKAKSSNSKTQISDFNLKNMTSPKSSDDASSTTVADSPTVAEDTDLIEKEWVAKAKKIIDDNREDPKNQSKEMTIFKADYMKKRYNKAVKVSE